ncbi:hypothetical protein BDK51DRAFT_46485 [Blyttiomyces helicus]|uniref:Uncharacterized protein n=1 Tax=Blyttiomyces helicus TaxID=388810 RepID=A0A4P9VXG8_9FUNG|nr:hypothetical protein BDK51DRAFT_46485 [Blyttiomyces helicus]|eukprot:RKO82978.1 hypothetical protein BDK51DRAFT_46485 [Blyttiomyces helicus]
MRSAPSRVALVARLSSTNCPARPDKSRKPLCGFFDLAAGHLWEGKNRLTLDPLSVLVRLGLPVGLMRREVSADGEVDDKPRCSLTPRHAPHRLPPVFRMHSPAPPYVLHRRASMHPPVPSTPTVRVTRQSELSLVERPLPSLSSRACTQIGAISAVAGVIALSISLEGSSAPWANGGGWVERMWGRCPDPGSRETPQGMGWNFGGCLTIFNAGIWNGGDDSWSISLGRRISLTFLQSLSLLLTLSCLISLPLSLCRAPSRRPVNPFLMPALLATLGAITALVALAMALFEFATEVALRREQGDSSARLGRGMGVDAAGVVCVCFAAGSLWWAGRSGKMKERGREWVEMEEVDCD